MSDAKPAKTARRDPPQRVARDLPVKSAVKNGNPAMRYMLAHPTADQFGVDWFEGFGWEPVLKHQDGPSVVAGGKSKAGQFVTYRSMVLMQKLATEVEAENADGQSLADELEAKIIDRGRGGIDPLRGMHKNYMHVVNKNQPPTVEVF